MNLFTNSYWFWESEIKPEVCDKWINEYFTNGKIEEATVGNGKGGYVTKNETRITDIVWIKPGTEIFDTIFNYVQSANKAAGWNFGTHGMEDVQLGRYADGGHYDWHIDSFPPDDGNWQRKLSCSILLSDPDTYEGGDLIFKLDANGTTETVTRKQGTVVVFPSYMAHMVTPVTKGERYSAVAWMKGQAFR
jgi:PKHD-type hydroxylase